MGQRIIIKQGIFSKLVIELGDDVRNTLAMMPKKENPLKAVQDDMEAVVAKFERLYFEASQAPTSPIPSEAQNG